MRCEWCDTRLEEGTLLCETCGRETSPAAAKETKPVRETTAEELAAMLPELNEPPPVALPKCPDHPDADAKQTCSRCGRFTCDACTSRPPPSFKRLCPECVERAVAAQERADPPFMLGTYWHAGFLVLLYLAAPLVANKGLHQILHSRLTWACVAYVFALVGTVVVLRSSRKRGWFLLLAALALLPTLVGLIRNGVSTAPWTTVFLIEPGLFWLSRYFSLRREGTLRKAS